MLSNCSRYIQTFVVKFPSLCEVVLACHTEDVRHGCLKVVSLLLQSLAYSGVHSLIDSIFRFHRSLLLGIVFESHWLISGVRFTHN